MKQIKLYISLVILFAFLFAGCNKETDSTPNESKGWIEYQYNYSLTVNGVATAKKGLKRVMITHAVFAPHQSKSLPDSLSKFNQLELFLYTDGADYANSTQPIGATYIQASLIDTVPNPEKLSLIEYRISTFNDFAKLKVPACLSLKSKINKLNGNSDSDNSSYELVFSGQNATNINVTALGDSFCEVNAFGIIDSKTNYRIYYKGPVSKGANYLAH